jgi:hypothetical protein
VVLVSLSGINGSMVKLVDDDGRIQNAYNDAIMRTKHLVLACCRE